MADWTDLSSNFGYGTKLSSALQLKLRDNITAAMEGASGSPDLGSGTVGAAQLIDAAISSLHLAENSIGAREINDASITVTQIANAAVTGDKISNNTITNGKIDFDVVISSVARTVTGTVSDCILTPVGFYGMYPIISINSVDGTDLAKISIESQITKVALSEVYSDNIIYDDGNYCPSIFMGLVLSDTAQAEITFRVKQYYIAASGQLKWIFLKLDKKTNEIISTYEAWDHPSHMSNPKIEQPFSNYNPMLHEIICINPSSDDLCRQEDLLDMGLDEVDIVRGSAIELDSSINFPRVIRENLPCNYKRRIKPIMKKTINYVPEPTKTNIKLARIKFK